MPQPNIDTDQNLIEDLDFVLDNCTTEVSEEKINSPSLHDGNEIEARYEIETDELNMILFPERFFQEILGDSQSLDEFTSLSPDLNSIQDLLIENPDIFPSTETNDIDEPIQSETDEHLAMIRTDNSTLSINPPQNKKLPMKTSSDQSISLSLSVAVTNPAPNSLQLAHSLEDTYRPRYKSDYFPSKGAVRRPRYVADNVGNHYVTLQMPTEYPRNLKSEYIRVALLTTAIDGFGHFYSPYKFQQNHSDSAVPDENPIYVPARESERFMKLHLVLIKSKLDQLNQAQPLKLFSDSDANVQNIIPQEKLTPKDLIAKYQLDKSHLAFTLCTKSSAGSYEIHPETTVISSVITEVSNKPTTSSNNKNKNNTNKSEKAAASVGKKISCPNCAHCFELSEGKAKQNEAKRSSNTQQSSNNHQSNKKQKLA